MKLTAKLLKKLIQEEIELGNFKDRLEAAKEKLEKLYGIKPETEDDLNKILQIMDDKIMSYHDFSQQADPSRYRAYYNDAFSKLPGAKEYDKVKGHLSMDEGHYHDMGGEDEMYDALDMPKRLSPKEIFGEFQNFVEVNNLSREDVEGMVEMLFSGVMDVPLNESPSMEHITPENIMMVINVLKDLGLLVAAAAGAALGISKMLDKTGKEEIPEK